MPLMLLERRVRRRASRAWGPGCAVGADTGEPMAAPEWRHPGYTPRRAAGLTGYERVLVRAGLSPVAGIDEAGRGACAGPLVVAAVMLNPAKLSGLTGIADSKQLTPAAREEAYQEVTRTALGWHRVIIPAQRDRLLRAARVQHRGHAPRPGRAHAPAGIRAHRRLRGTRPRRARPGHVEGRRGGRVRGRRLHRGQGDQGPDHDRAVGAATRNTGSPSTRDTPPAVTCAR